MIVETTKMSTRGQVIIPREIREYIDADRNTIFTVSPLDKETIVMKKLDKDKLAEEFAKIRSKTAGKLSEEDIDNEIDGYRKSKRGS